MKKIINSTDQSGIAKITKSFSRINQYYIIDEKGWRFNVKKGFSTIRKMKYEK